MARITDYSTLSSPATNDVLAIVDVDDTTMSAQGTTKQITVTNLLSLALPSHALTVSPTAPSNPSYGDVWIEVL